MEGGEELSNHPITGFPWAQAILAGGKTEKEMAKHPVKRLLCLSDPVLVTNPQEGCCYCLGVGEAGERNLWYEEMLDKLFLLAERGY